MFRHLGFGLFGAMLSTASVTAQAPVLLKCELVGEAPEDLSSFASLVCVQAAKQLQTMADRPVQVVSGYSFSDTQAQPWLYLKITVENPYVAHGQASWGGGNLSPGLGPLLEAGIDDASLNQTTVASLVQIMLQGSPFTDEK